MKKILTLALVGTAALGAATFTSCNNGGGDDPEGTFTSIASLKTWLAAQPDNTSATPYKIALKGVNLDAGNNWNDLGVAVKGDNFIELDLSACTGTTIPDGYDEFKPGGVIITYGTFVDIDNLLAVKLPAGLKTVGQYAFYDCGNLASVTLPASIETLGKYAFSYCIELETIVLPDGLKTLGGDLFQRSGLKTVTIPGSVTNWEAGTFKHCEYLTTVTIEDGVTAIGEDAFWRDSSLAELIVLCTVPPTLKVTTNGLEPLEDTPATMKIKVPAASLDAYKTAEGWKAYADKITAN
jgi:hypothetical protein